MLNLIFLSPHSDPEAELGEQDAGGQCVYEHQLAQALVALYDDIRVTTFCRQVGKRKSISQVHDRYAIKRIKAGGSGFIPKELFEPLLPEFVASLNQNLEGLKNVLIHAHYWDGGKAALLLKKMHSKYVPLVWTPHSLGAIKRNNFRNVDNENTYNFIPRLVWENYTILAANKLIVSSEREKQALKNHYALGEEKALVVPPGIDVAHFAPIHKHEARKKLGLAQKPLMLLSVGRMEPTKGFDHAIESAHIFRQIYSKPFELHIYSGNARHMTSRQRAYTQSLAEKIKSRGLTNHVKLHDALSHDRINLAYAAADIFMMLSDNEPYGFTLLEAMASETASIASNSGGASSVISQNRNGILVHPHKPAIIATYLRALALDVEYRASIAQNARQTIVDSFGWEIQAKKFREVYESVLLDSEHFSYDQWISDNYFLANTLGGMQDYDHLPN
jgi:D-inositol-3-phosphate glycosyltransferase